MSDFPNVLRIKKPMIGLIQMVACCNGLDPEN